MSSLKTSPVPVVLQQPLVEPNSPLVDDRSDQLVRRESDLHDRIEGPSRKRQSHQALHDISEPNTADSGDATSQRDVSSLSPGRESNSRVTRLVAAFNKRIVDPRQESFEAENDQHSAEDRVESFTCEQVGCVWPCSYHWHEAKTPDFIWARHGISTIPQCDSDPGHADDCKYCEVFNAVAGLYCTCYRNYRRDHPQDCCQHEAFYAKFRDGILDQLEGVWSCARGADRLELAIEDPTTSLLPLRPISGSYHTNSSSAESISMYRSWIDNCDRTHPNCFIATNGSPPSRVIDCLSSSSLRLCDTTSGWNEKYLALSYCWGGMELPVTLLENLDDRRSLLPWNILPPLHQDLIMLAQGLQIRYVWIDALCIVQDDIQDKNREIPRMGDIFQNAFLVVIAASAASPRNRLFRLSRSVTDIDRNKTWRDVSLPDLRHVDLEGIKFRKYCHGWRFPHIDRRAWTYQERLLARRCLVFHYQDVMWDCRGGCQCECSGHQAKLRTQEAFHSQLLPWTGERSPEDTKSRHFTNAADAYSFWKQAVETFSSRRTSYDKDRLPAISALARTVQEATGDHYLAGMWKGDLKAQLMWSCEETMGGARVPQGYLAPSWSWVSACAPANYNRSKYRTESAIVDVVEVECRLAGDNPFGEVVNGSLVLRGVHCNTDIRISGGTDPQQLVERAYIELYFDDGTYHFGEGPHLEHTFLDGYRVCTMRLDTASIQGLETLQRIPNRQLEEQPDCSGAAHILWLEESVALILAHSIRRRGCFERLGILFGEAVPPMPDLEPSTITIV